MNTNTNYEKILIGGIVRGLIKPSALTVDSGDLELLGRALTVSRELEAEKKTVDEELLAMRLTERFPDDNFYTQDDFKLFGQMVSSSNVCLEAEEKIKAGALSTYLRTNLATILADEQRSGANILDDLKHLLVFADTNYRTRENNFVPLSEIVGKLGAVLTDLYNNISYAVTTGFGTLDDNLLDGFSKGDQHVIVGRTGHGKSALALNCARRQAKLGAVVGVVSREMSSVENAMRLQSIDQNIPRWQMRKGIHEHTYNNLMSGLDGLGELKIWFDTRTPYIEDLAVQTKLMCETHGLTILYVDTVQLVKTEQKRNGRAEIIGDVSRGLKEIAMENNIPVVSLSQFNRGVLNANTFDLLEHLKDSSGIEQDASSVTYVQIDNSIPEAHTKPAKIQILKNRNGATYKELFYSYRGETFTFTENAVENIQTEATTNGSTNGADDFEFGF